MGNDKVDAFVKLLLEDGWQKAGPISYRKGHWEIVFDTSSWMELGNQRNPRLFDVPVPESGAGGKGRWTLNLINHLFKADDQIATFLA